MSWLCIKCVEILLYLMFCKLVFLSLSMALNAWFRFFLKFLFTWFINVLATLLATLCHCSGRNIQTLKVLICDYDCFFVCLEGHQNPLIHLHCVSKCGCSQVWCCNIHCLWWLGLHSGGDYNRSSSLCGASSNKATWCCYLLDSCESRMNTKIL